MRLHLNYLFFFLIYNMRIFSSVRGGSLPLGALLVATPVAAAGGNFPPQGAKPYGPCHNFNRFACIVCFTILNVMFNNNNRNLSNLT